MQSCSNPFCYKQTKQFLFSNGIQAVDSFGNYIKYLEASDVQDADEVLPLHFGVEGFVDTIHEPLESSTVDGLAQRSD